VNRLPSFLSPLLVGLIAILFTNSIGYTKALSLANSALSCGEWTVKSADGSDDKRIGVTLNGIENDCSGTFTLQNQTGSPGKLLSGYSLAITPLSNNAEVKFSQHVPILMPGLEMEVVTTPTSIGIGKGATVLLQSGVTLLSIAADADLFILDSLFALLPDWCVPSPKEVLFISLRTAPILENAVKLASQGDIPESIEEVSRLNREFHKKFMEAAENLSLDCIIEYYSKDLAPIVNILKPYLSWLGSTYFGYLEHGSIVAGPVVSLSYIQPSFITQKPTQEITLSLTPEPPVLVEGNQCSGEKWSFEPIALYRYKNFRGEFDLVILEFQVYNGSDKYWGSMSNIGYINIVTELGTSYIPNDIAEKPVVPNDPPSPYSGSEHHRMMERTGMLAPNTVSPGWLDRQTGKVLPHNYAFYIPSTAKLLTVNLGNIQISCEISQTKYSSSDITDLSYSLEKFPASQTTSAPIIPTQGGQVIQASNPACQNDYFPVVDNAHWVYLRSQSGKDRPSITKYERRQIAEILTNPNKFTLYIDLSDTTEFPRRDDPSQVDFVWHCLDGGLGDRNAFMVDIAKEMPAGFTWTIDPVHEMIDAPTYTSLGIESVSVPAGAFNAVKVQEESPRGSVVHWYVVGVGEVKTYYSPQPLGIEVTYELVSYSIPH
jgi:hypothetical protein